MRRFALFLGLVALIGASACGTDQPTNPNPVPIPIPAAAEAPAQPTSPPAATAPTAPNPGVNVQNGVVTINNHPDEVFEARVCYFQYAGKNVHPQKLLDVINRDVPGQANRTIRPPEGMCDTVQLDVGRKGRINCGNPSNALGEVLMWEVWKTGVPCDCVPGEWTEIPGSRLTRRTRWGACPAADVTEICYECREVRSSWKETNGCDERNQNSEELERREVECPVECDVPAEGTTLTWSGRGDPQTECRAFGPYDAGEPADFYLCKAGNDREVWYSEPGPVCLNGKERSHTTRCVCSEGV